MAPTPPPPFVCNHRKTSFPQRPNAPIRRPNHYTKTPQGANRDQRVAIDDPMKTEHLLSLDGAKERLQLFKADLVEEGSFDSALDGCQGVFNTASPVIHTAGDPQSQIIDPAVKGTLNVLHSCAKVPLSSE